MRHFISQVLNTSGIGIFANARIVTIRLCSPAVGVDDDSSRVFPCIAEYHSSVCTASRDLRYDASDFVSVVE